jgi:hypothetical protein
LWSESRSGAGSATDRHYVMPLPQLVIPTAARLNVKLTGGPTVHPTAGYREWRGQAESTEPIVALALTIAGSRVSWTRTSHRGDSSLPVSVMFAPYDEEARRIQVSFMIMDAGTVSQTLVDSMQTQPTPMPRSFSTGELVTIATIHSDPPCELKALFLARRDVASVRNGVWHARGDVVATLAEPWRKILTYGRTGEFEAA